MAFPEYMIEPFTAWWTNRIITPETPEPIRERFNQNLANNIQHTPRERNKQGTSSFLALDSRSEIISAALTESSIPEHCISSTTCCRAILHSDGRILTATQASQNLEELRHASSPATPWTPPQTLAAQEAPYFMEERFFRLFHLDNGSAVTIIGLDRQTTKTVSDNRDYYIERGTAPLETFNALTPADVPKLATPAIKRAWLDSQSHPLGLPSGTKVSDTPTCLCIRSEAARLFRMDHTGATGADGDYCLFNTGDFVLYMPNNTKVIKPESLREGKILLTPTNATGKPCTAQPRHINTISPEFAPLLGPFPQPK